MKKRLRALAWVLTLAMLCQMLPLSAFAQAGAELSGAVQALLDMENGIVDSGTFGAEGDNLTWTLEEDGTLTISGEGAMEDWDDENFAPWLSRSPKIIHVVVEEGVTNISKKAFSFCENLADITLPDSVTSIGYSAFWHCSSLIEITIPASVRSIDPYSFLECKNLSKFSVVDGNQHYRAPDGVLFDFAKTHLICYPAGKTDSQYDIPTGVTTIGDFAFSYNSSLTSITIPDTVESIGEYAFSDCTGLTRITLPDTVESIGKYAFSHCTGLARITIPESVTRIEYYALNNCSSLKDVFYRGTQAQWKDISKGEYGNECLKSVQIHYNCTDIEPGQTCTISVTHGTASVNGVSVSSANPGETVTLTADDRSDEGLSFSGWVVEQGNVTLQDEFAEETTFEMGTENVSVKAEYWSGGSDHPGGSGGSSGGGAILMVGVAAAAAAAVIAVVLMMPVQVQGRVAFADDTAVPGAKITLTKDGRIVAETTADASGAFTLETTRGEYELLVSYTDAEGQLVQKTTPVKVPLENTVIRI